MKETLKTLEKRANELKEKIEKKESLEREITEVLNKEENSK